MSDKVVSLTGDPIAQPGEAVASVVQELEWLLEAAKSGEITGLAAAWLWRDGSAGHGFKGVCAYSQIGRLVSLQSAMVEELRK